MSKTKNTLRAVLSGMVHVAFIAFAIAMAFAVYRLGEFYEQPEVYRVLTAAACALGIIGHGSAVTRGGTNASRTLHGLALGTWLVLSIFLASLYMVNSSERLRAVLPAQLVLIGGYVYALTFAIGLFTSTLALVIPSAAERPIADAAHTTLGSVIAKYGEPVAIMLAIAASSLHLFLFGQNVARLDLFSTLAAMLIADLAFLVSEKRVVSELRARRDKGRYDKFDLILWGLFGLAVLCYLVLVNIFSVRHSAGTLDPGDPMLARVIDFYAASPSILILCLAALALITALVDKPSGTPDVIEGDVTISKPARPALASRAATQIRTQREALGDLRQALRGDKATIKPKRIMLADEGATTTPVLEPTTTTTATPDSAGNGAPARPKSRKP